MHKFPQLDKIAFSVKDEYNAPLDYHVLTQFLNYLSKIKSVSVLYVPVDKDTVSKTFGDYWDLVSTPGSECVKFVYNIYERMPACALQISRKSNESTTSLIYPVGEPDYADFLEKNGKYINALQYKSSITGLNGVDFELPGESIAKILTNCPNLQKLKIKGWILKHLSHSQIDLLTNYLLNELCFNRCFFYPGAFEQLSLLLSKVKILRIDGILYIDPQYIPLELQELPPGEPDLQIIMPQTDIDCITFKESFFIKPIHLKVFAASEAKYYYYRFETSIELSDEQEYTRSNDDVRVYVYCTSLPKFEFLTT